MKWQYARPFVTQWQVSADQIDHYHHANNVVFVQQLEKTAWAHSNELGLDIQQYQALDRGMAISRHEINYLAAAYLDDVIDCATWIVACDGRLKLTRHFQFIRRDDLQTVLTASTDFVCIGLSSGQPKRMPRIFADIYTRATINI
ncbi:acyl-CoA thioesterase [Paraglaciecola aestuariivivens]